jgi:hypothetical protein
MSTRYASVRRGPPSALYLHDAANFYHTVTPTLLPHGYPDGIDGESLQHLHLAHLDVARYVVLAAEQGDYAEHAANCEHPFAN